MYFGFGNAPFVHPFDRVLSVNQLQGFTPAPSRDHSRKIASAPNNFAYRCEVYPEVLNG
jgi:hypothetical protein